MLPLTDGSTHAVLMPHVDRAALDEFLADLRAVSVSRPRDGDA